MQRPLPGNNHEGRRGSRYLLLEPQSAGHGDSLHPTQRGNGGKVIQILGGMGSPEAQGHATSLTQSWQICLERPPSCSPLRA